MNLTHIVRSRCTKYYTIAAQPATSRRRDNLPSAILFFVDVVALYINYTATAPGNDAKYA